LLTSRAIKSEKSDLQRPPWFLPGKDDAFKLTIADRLAAVERDILSSKKLCSECHYFQGDIGTGKLSALKIEPTNVPLRWYEAARFNHASHRLLECRSCHVVESSVTAADVAIPNLDNCRQCHGPSQMTAEGPRGGARYGCTECHTYHNGDHPGLGKGAIQRAPAKRDLSEFLKPSR
jgi:hypothetical protein